MTTEPEDPSRVRSAHFDRATHTLRVEFDEGPAYEFADVPERVYDELARTATPDEYFRAHVQNEFTGSPSDEIDLADLADERREDAVLGAPLAEQIDSAVDVPRDREVDVRASRHTWVVEVMDDDAVAIEVDGRRITPIPRWLLPADARDGDVLRVKHARSGTQSMLSIEVDHEADRTA